MEFQEQFKTLLNSPLGKELIRCLEQDLHSSLISDAQVAPTQEQAYGLLKEAAGVIKAVGHIQYMAAQLPSNEGSSNN